MTQTDQNAATHWMVRLAESDLFRKLPAASMRVLLEQFDQISVPAGQVVIHQGDLGDYYYVIESGHCEVTRKDPGDATPALLATLGPGDAFGEEDTASGSSRNADVSMKEDGVLLRLKLETFNDVVRDALIDKVPYRIAQRMHDDGAHWLDVRSQEEFSTLARLQPCLHLPLSTLRESYAEVLSPNESYIVCAEEHSVAAVATLLLVQRSIDAVCLTESVSSVAPERASESTQDKIVAFPNAQLSHATGRDEELVRQARAHEHKIAELESSEPISRDLYDDTYVGQSLADLIDQMHTRQHDLLSAEGPEDAATPTDPDEVDVAEFEQVVEQQIAEADTEAPIEEPHRASVVPRSDAIANYLSGLDRLINELVNERVQNERLAIRQRSEQKVADIRRSAIAEVKRQTARYRDKLKQEHDNKQKTLKSQYDKLMGLAHRISRQKAELKNARAQLQAKLSATTKLQAELNTLRSSLSESIGTFDSLDESDSSG